MILPTYWKNAQRMKLTFDGVKEWSDYEALWKKSL